MLGDMTAVKRNNVLNKQKLTYQCHHFIQSHWDIGVSLDHEHPNGPCNRSKTLNANAQKKNFSLCVRTTKALCGCEC